MGYYMAGGTVSMVPSHTTTTPAGPALDSGPTADRPRRRARIDLTALRRAQRRVDRFVKLARKMVPHNRTHRIKTKRGKR